MSRTHRTFRLFVSSTFADMTVERQLLHRRVFPVIDSWCRERGASFQVIDLRWGVNEQHQREHRTVEVCLSEIARCQRLSPAPNFLVLLGERYGWEPVPARVPVAEFDQLCLAAVESDRQLLLDWYRRDDNAVPAVMCLRPTSGLPADALSWSESEPALKAALRRAVVKTALSEEERSKYFRSATHQEIMAGILGIPASEDAHDPGQHVLACFRDIEGLPDLDRTYRDENCGAVKQLREAVRARLPGQNILDYSAMWRSSTGSVAFDEEAFVERILGHLRGVIDRELSSFDPAVGESVSPEGHVHERLRQEISSLVVGRDADARMVLESLERHRGDCPLFLAAPVGAGKSALVSLVASLASRVVLVRFCGRTPESARVDILLRDIVSELEERFVAAQQPVSERQLLLERLSVLLRMATAERPLTLVLDGVDQLDQLRSLADWWPDPLPPHVSVLLSGTSDVALYLPRHEMTALRPLTLQEGGEMLDALLSRSNRIVSREQRAVVLNAFKSTPVPLFLVLASFEAVRWASWSSPESFPSSIDGMVAFVIDRLSREHDPVRGGSHAPLVDCVLACLSAARYGLSEAELLGALAADTDFMQRFSASTHHPIENGRIPDAIWSRLLFELDALISERHAQGTLVLTLNHRVAGVAIRNRFVSSVSSRSGHAALGRYFAELPTWLDSAATRPNVRKVAELPWQLSQNERFSEWAECVTDVDFVVATAETDLLAVLTDDMIASEPRLPSEIQQSVASWRRVLESKAHLLSRGQASWSTSRILAQVAHELPLRHPVRDVVTKWMSRRRPEQITLHSAVPDARASAGGVRALEGHRGAPSTVLLLADGRVISCAASADGAARAWDIATGRCQLLDHGRTSVDGVIVSSSGAVITWCSDGSIHLWHGVGMTRMLRLTGHTGAVTGVEELPNGDLLSWSMDGTIRRWDVVAGVCLRIVAAHAGGVTRLLTIAGERIISVGSDGQRIWTADGTMLSARPQYRDIARGSGAQIISHVERPDGVCRVVVEDEDTLAVVCVLDESRVSDRWYDELFSLYESLPIGDDFNIWRQAPDWHVAHAVVAVDRVITWRPGRTWSPFGWNTASGECLGIWPDRGFRFSGAVPLPGGRALLWGQKGVLAVWDPASAEDLQLLSRDGSAITAVLRLADGQVVEGREDGVLQSWNLLVGKRTAVFEGHGGSVLGLAELPDGRILSWSSDRSIRVWAREDFAVTDGSRPRGAGLRAGVANGPPIRDAIAIGADRFAAWAGYAQIRIWDGRSGSLVSTLDHRGLRLQGFQRLRGGRLLTWGHGGEGVKKATVWDAEGRALFTRDGIFSWHRSFPEFLDGSLLTAGEWVSGRGAFGCVWSPGEDTLIALSDFVAQYSTHQLKGAPILFARPRLDGIAQGFLGTGEEHWVRRCADGGFLCWRGVMMYRVKPDGELGWERRRNSRVGGMMMRGDGSVIVWPEAGGQAEVFDGRTGARVAVLPTTGGETISVVELQDESLMMVQSAASIPGSLPLFDDTILRVGGDFSVSTCSRPVDVFDAEPALWARWASVRGVAAQTAAAVIHHSTVFLVKDGVPTCWHGDGTWTLDAIHDSGVIMLHREDRPCFLTLASGQAR